MIRLFRNIRQKLVSENKVIAYLRYAIGEILLVVIGILIALQVNNWNENRKLQNDKHKLLQALKKEFLENKANLEEQVKGLTKSDIYFSKVLNFSAGAKPDLSIDSLRFYTSKIIYYFKLSLLSSVQEEAVSSGKFELLGEHLKPLLSKFKDYTNSFNSINEHSDYFFTSDENELLIKLSVYQDIYNQFFPNRPISIHPKLVKNDKEFVAYIKLPKTYTLLYKFYFNNIREEIWLKDGLLALTNNILKEIDKQLN